jgi:D-3-phosphoglycerate dehydrogenase
VEKVKAFDFRVLAYDPYLETASAGSAVELVSFERLLGESDIVSVHAPLTRETQGMLGYAQFKMMKKEAFLINTARGGLIQERDLVRALEEGLLAGAGLDLLESEDLDPQNPLLSFNNVTITPHVAFYSEQSVQDLQTRAVQEVVRILSGKAPGVCLNPEVLQQ